MRVKSIRIQNLRAITPRVLPDVVEPDGRQGAIVFRAHAASAVCRNDVVPQPSRRQLTSKPPLSVRSRISGGSNRRCERSPASQNVPRRLIARVSRAHHSRMDRLNCRIHQALACMRKR